MNLPQVYMCSPSWTLLHPPSPFHPSGWSQCTSPKHPVSCIEPGLATHFIHDILHVSMPLGEFLWFVIYILSCSQFVYEITKAETVEEIWSCVNYLFFIYSSLIYGKKQHIRHGIVWSKYLKAVVWLEMSGVKGAWFKVSNKTKRPPEKSCLQN